MAFTGTGLIKQRNNRPIENFSFVFDGEFSCDLDFTIQLGNQIYRSALSDWSTDLETIRHDLESFVFHRETALQLFFEDSPTIISLRAKFALDDYLFVSVKPDEFAENKYSEISGYCSTKDCIETIYSAFLQCALSTPLITEETVGDGWPNRLIFYNKIKSPIIEAFLRDEHTKEDEYSLRQVHVKSIIRIDPNYDYFLMDDENIACSLDDLYTRDGQPISLPAFEAWQQEMCPIIVNSETGKSYDKDWQDYHRRGLEFAKQLREALSPDFDLWYEAPYEDKSGTIPKPILIV